jgi:23S rRNA (cytidine1920-2'-O)/16S rRNA (cytidine1409-2'-O)-methyltransferase
MKQRLDQALVARGLAETRSRARDLVRRGAVSVDGAASAKPGALVAPGSALSVAPEAGAARVSRGALKLEAGLDAFALSPRGRIALDIGASTGGFTEVLLERGALRVYAVDAGHGQLHGRLRGDPRVAVLEGCDARALNAAIVPERAGAVVADVSFISLTKALPRALTFAAPGAWLVALVKPQFEAGPQAVGKNGLVKDESKIAAAVDGVAAWIAGQPGWRVLGVVPSPIAGGSGAREFLLGAGFAG